MDPPGFRLPPSGLSRASAHVTGPSVIPLPLRLLSTWAALNVSWVRGRLPLPGPLRLETPLGSDSAGAPGRAAPPTAHTAASSSLPPSRALSGPLDSRSKPAVAPFRLPPRPEGGDPCAFPSFSGACCFLAAQARPALLRPRASRFLSFQASAGFTELELLPRGGRNGVGGEDRYTVYFPQDWASALACCRFELFGDPEGHPEAPSPTPGEAAAPESARCSGFQPDPARASFPSALPVCIAWVV